jgi:hypothetical protein
MTKDLENSVKQFIISVRARATQDTIYAIATRDQVIKLIIQMNAALEDKEMRKPVLSAITGLRVNTQTLLTAHYHSVLIDETMEGKSDAILRRIEGLVKTRYLFHPWDLYPRQGTGKPVPVVPEAAPF